MKKSITLLPFITFATCLLAQSKAIGITAGASVFNSKSASLQYESQVNGKNYLGIFAETFFYCDTKQSITLSSGQTHYYVGLYYKPSLHSSRNFSNYFLFGAAAGTHGKKFLYYSFAGFEQDFYIGDKTIFFVAEELKYLVPLKNKWQPFIKTGVKFSVR